MHPILFRIPLPNFTLPWLGWEIGPIAIYSYGVMLGLSLIVGWYLTLGLAERDGLPKEKMANNYVFTAIAAVLGSRVLYILTNLDEFETFGSLFELRRGGLVAYGGFLGGFIGSLVYLRKNNLPLLPWADVAVPSLASGLMITRIGCYLFGCDFGQTLTEAAPSWLRSLGTFPHWPEGTLEQGAGAPAWVHHVKTRGLATTSEASLPVHPTQLYESLIGLGLLALLLVARKKQKFRGQIFFLFTFAYGCCRYLIELLRDDAERGSIPPSLPEHVLLPFGITVLAVGYLIGFSRMVENLTLRRLTQVLAFVPGVVLYLVLRPESFAGASNVMWSTSQFVAMTTGFAVAIAYNVFDKAATAHPETAMRLDLPPEEGAESADDDEDEEARPQAKAAAKRSPEKKAAAKKAAAKELAKEEAEEKAETEDDADGDESAASKEGSKGGATKEEAAPETEEK
jgi:phosphatidylglycerol:prolipoprotein diacylglycerol transferase